jgi:hypothetical protein
MYVLAFPSSTPTYVFDESGRLVDWCPDPGDLSETSSWWERWPLREARPLELSAFKARFGL